VINKFSEKGRAIGIFIDIKKSNKINRDEIKIECQKFSNNYGVHTIIFILHFLK